MVLAGRVIEPRIAGVQRRKQIGAAADSHLVQIEVRRLAEFGSQPLRLIETGGIRKCPDRAGCRVRQVVNKGQRGFANIVHYGAHRSGTIQKDDERHREGFRFHLNDRALETQGFTRRRIGGKPLKRRDDNTPLMIFE